MCMEKVKVTVAKLSERTGISERQIGRMRKDEVKDIGFRTIIALCVALNLAMETAERLLNLKRYTLNCDEPYVQVCKMFLEVMHLPYPRSDPVPAAGLPPPEGSCRVRRFRPKG